MVVRLHLERRHPAVADVDDPRVLARPLPHARPARRELAEVNARRLVRTVLRPHDREDPELEVIRRPPEDLFDAGVLVRREPVLGDDGGGDGWVLLHAPRLWRRHVWPGCRVARLPGCPVANRQLGFPATRQPSHQCIGGGPGSRCCAIAAATYASNFAFCSGVRYDASLLTSPSCAALS